MAHYKAVLAAMIGEFRAADKLKKAILAPQMKEQHARYMQLKALVAGLRVAVGGAAAAEARSAVEGEIGRLQTSIAAQLAVTVTDCRALVAADPPDVAMAPVEDPVVMDTPAAPMQAAVYLSVPSNVVLYPEQLQQAIGVSTSPIQSLIAHARLHRYRHSSSSASSRWPPAPPMPCCTSCPWTVTSPPARCPSLSLLVVVPHHSVHSGHADTDRRSPRRLARNHGGSAGALTATRLPIVVVCIDVCVRVSVYRCMFVCGALLAVTACVNTMLFVSSLSYSPAFYRTPQSLVMSPLSCQYNQHRHHRPRASQAAT